MRIYKMTATFGKLENQTLTLQPGLNILSAPNEWGKSTWCAFLATMLYGLDTREKTTKTSLAVKERYAPWSCAPMSGRIDLNWNDKDITIERWTKGRTPMGEFRAYETASGLAVTELTGSNCGETLLGVEKSVFLRSSFIRLSDLPVTADESLRRRLNALVTTGDESGAGDTLAQKLKDLKNKIRYNRSGLLPQAEAQRSELENKLLELNALQQQQANVLQRQQQLDVQIAALENHKIALQYAAAEENMHRIAAAQEAADSAAQHMDRLNAQCAALPSAEAAQQKLDALLSLQQQQQTVQLDAQMLPQPPQVPHTPPYFYGLSGNKAIDQVNTDIADYHACKATPKKTFPLWTLALLALIGGAVLLVMELAVPGILALVAGMILLVLYALQYSKERTVLMTRTARAESIRTRYGGGEPSDWLADAQLYAQQQAQYEADLAQYQQMRQQLEQRLAQLNAAIAAATGDRSLPSTMEYWKKVLQLHDALADAQREQKRAADHAEAIKAVAKPAQKPDRPDTLQFTAADTEKMLADAYYEQKQLQQRQGQCEGRMESLGTESTLQNQLDAVRSRIEKLTQTYNALELAQQTLQAATAELQRRFAPRIAQQAQELFSTLTGGRYDRLNLQQDLSINAASTEDVAMRSTQWRSEGTVDQLYLALRLAVARELTPNAPLVLDDALVRFDDVRHAAAMEILRQEAESKQVILFTCQSREL